jgi:hypothetical protein
MWNNYFWNIQKKYSMKISKKEPLIIRLDGKSVTKNKDINLMELKEKSFNYAMEKTVVYFTKKYQGLAIYGSDEVSFIFEKPEFIIDDMSTEKSQHSNEIISLFSQYFFQYFNSFNKHRVIFWHAKCFSINREKIISYIKYRSRIIENVMITYYLNRNNIRLENIKKLNDKIKECEKLENYSSIRKIQKGNLIYKGEKIKLEQFINGKIEKFEDNDEIESLFSELNEIFKKT